MTGGNVEYGREVIRLEAAAVAALGPLLGESFHRAVEMVLACEGHVVTTGMGKSGIIAQKVSATLASTGTPSFFLHPAEALHGDLGRVGDRDLLVALSNSGTTEEIRRLGDREEDLRGLGGHPCGSAGPRRPEEEGSACGRLLLVLRWKRRKRGIFLACRRFR